MRRIFDALAMASAGFGSPGQCGTSEQPWGHREVKGEIQPAQLGNAPPLEPSGAVHCSLPEWSRLAALHLAASRGRPPRCDPATLLKSVFIAGILQERRISILILNR